jgi:thiamine-monophosphate kinase
METRENKPASEAELIALFKSLFEPEEMPSDLLVGIGDDAAVIEPGVDMEMKTIITTDMLVEDVHFRRNSHSFFDIGWRTAVANISDIAAMGGIPRWGVVSLAATSDMAVDDIMEIARGLKEAMSDHGAFVIGGDLTSSTSKVSISMTVIGESSSMITTRRGAQLGDVIAVTGKLGWSGAGLAILENEDSEVPDDLRELIINKHKKPVPRVRAGNVFSNISGIHAVIDISDGLGIDLISDGLGIDLSRLCRAGSVGCRIFEERIPVPDEVLKVAEILGRDHLEFVTAGEDFELLVVGDESAIDTADQAIRESDNESGLSKIGEIIDEPFGMHLARVDGSVLNPAMLGWDHFRKGK